MIFIFKYLKRFIILQILIIFIISIFFSPIIFGNIVPNNPEQEEINKILQISPSGFIWPIPGYNRISSQFGKRTSPTSGASSYHSGIDIPAPPGTKFVAVHDGTITFRQFLGAGGFTITLSFNNYKVSYCHCDPNFIVEIGQEIKQGQVIGMVGPKNVYGVLGNIYKDAQGNPTNGATTGPHLHFGVRKDGQYQNPLSFYE